MDGLFFYTFFHTLLMVVFADHEYMVNSPENLIVPEGFETQLTCRMNIPPDKFIWKFYQFDDKNIYNSKLLLNLNKAPFVHIAPDNVENSEAKLNIKVQDNPKRIAGDYQCLAYYGASVVASIPSRITIAMLGEFTERTQKRTEISVGNSVIWKCLIPPANPQPFVDYYKGETYIEPTELSRTIQSLIIENATKTHSGVYRCAISLPTKMPPHKSEESFSLNVVDNGAPGAPYFIAPLKKVYTVTKDASIFLECAAVGNPVPRVFWYRKNGQLPTNRTELVNGGFRIRNVTSKDEGVYVCDHRNVYGSISESITLVYNEEPSVECTTNSTEVKQSEKLDLECRVRGVPEPIIAWFLNGYSVLNDTAIEAIGNKIYFSSVEKRHAGNLQCFASNSVKTVYGTVGIRVIPTSTSGDGFYQATSGHRHGGKKNHVPKKPVKSPKMIPPNKPTVTRLNDQAVVVRWSVNSNTGLPIMFFKVQYRELGPISVPEHHKNKASRWRTCNDDIAPHITSYDVSGLKANYVYRFRIAAVYSNNDNKLSNNSDKFYLRKIDFDDDFKPPIPLITHTEPISATAVKIYWKTTAQPNITIDGFFINFISASRAGDYSIQTVDGTNTSFFVLSHLQPDTFYDIKLQSFTSKSVSEFSQIMRAKTLPQPATENPLLSSSTTTVLPTSVSTVSPSTDTESSGISNLYIFIAVGVVGGGLLIAGVAVLIGCRKWKQKKQADNERHKPAVEEHHIQADGNEYVVTPRAIPRANGCVLPQNRITITSNPLAEAETKSQNMIELTCLSSQNNNCTAPQQTAPHSGGGAPHSGGESPSNSAEKSKKVKKASRKTHSGAAAAPAAATENPPLDSGDNYV